MFVDRVLLTDHMRMLAQKASHTHAHAHTHAHTHTL